jgi:ABC-2 type transport system ATP-binding protein
VRWFKQLSRSVNVSEFVLTLTNVSKSFDYKPVLDQVSLAIPPGSVVGLLGKNGTGKTTLIKCALGLLKPQSGEITVFGEPAWTLSGAAKARIGYVPQTPALYPWMRVRQIVDYQASFYPHWNDELIDGLLSEWNLDPAAKVGPLSVGQQQKLSILLAIGHEPDFLVLDEPAAALDPEARRNFVRTVLDLVGKGRTVLFSTHITSDLERIAERIVILEQGRVTVDEELDRLKERIKRLHITSREALPSGFAVPGALRFERNGSEALVSVPNSSPELIQELERRWAVTVEVEDLSLEDIFLEVTRA